jgi:hypothetical protein
VRSLSALSKWRPARSAPTPHSPITWPYVPFSHGLSLPCPVSACWQKCRAFDKYLCLAPPLFSCGRTERQGTLSTCSIIRMCSSRRGTTDEAAVRTSQISASFKCMCNPTSRITSLRMLTLACCTGSFVPCSRQFTCVRQQAREQPLSSLKSCSHRPTIMDPRDMVRLISLVLG